jgi:hypothetical protein
MAAFAAAIAAEHAARLVISVPAAHVSPSSVRTRLRTGAAQTSHPLLVTLLSDDHVKALLPSTTLLGPVVPLYSSPFTVSLSQQASVLKSAVALRSWPAARLVGVIVHDWLMP